MPARHPILKSILPARWFAAVKAGTRQWLIECPCGHKEDLWDAGGVRYKAAGEPRQLRYCRLCDRNRWHKVRRKTQQEREELPGACDTEKQ